MMSSPVCYENNEIKFSSGVSYKFKFSIAEIKVFEKIVIVRLDIPAKVIHNENVYGISENGELIWQIEKIGHIYDDSPYTGMAVKENKLILYNWDGLEVKIDPKTGKVFSKSFGR